MSEDKKIAGLTTYENEIIKALKDINSSLKDLAAKLPTGDKPLEVNVNGSIKEIK